MPSFCFEFFDKRLSLTWPLSVSELLYKFACACIRIYTLQSWFTSMGRSDENISFWKTPTLHIPAAQLGSLTLLVEQPQRQNISPLLVSNQSRRDTASRSSENVPRGPPPRYYEQSQSRDVLPHSGAVGGSSAYTSPGVGSTAHFPGGVLNRYFLIEDSMQPLQNTAFQSPVMVVPSYTTNATTRSHGGNTIHSSQLQYVTSPSGVGASPGNLANARHQLYAGPPAQVSGGIPHRNSVLANPVSLQPDTVSRPFSGNPSYGSKFIAPIYESDVRHVPQSHVAEPSRSTVYPAYRSFDHPPYSQAPPPLPSLSSIQASRIDASHPTSNQPTPFAERIVQAASFSDHGAQQPGLPQVFHIDGCFIDEDDLTDQETNDDIIIVGKCLRNDSPCGLWVKANKGSLKRHAHKWHGVVRGGDTDIVSCTWAECNVKMLKSSVPRHTLCTHLGETFRCNGCSRIFTRDYSWRSHAAKCTYGVCGYSVTYIPSARAIDLKGISPKQVSH